MLRTDNLVHLHKTAVKKFREPQPPGALTGLSKPAYGLVYLSLYILEYAATHNCNSAISMSKIKKITACRKYRDENAAALLSSHKFARLP